MNKWVKRTLCQILVIAMTIPTFSSIFTFESKADTYDDSPFLTIGGVNFQALKDSDDIYNGIKDGVELKGDKKSLFHSTYDGKDYLVTFRDGDEKILDIVPYAALRVPFKTYDLGEDKGEHNFTLGTLVITVLFPKKSIDTSYINITESGNNNSANEKNVLVVATVSPDTGVAIHKASYYAVMPIEAVNEFVNAAKGNTKYGTEKFDPANFDTNKGKYNNPKSEGVKFRTVLHAQYYNTAEFPSAGASGTCNSGGDGRNIFGNSDNYSEAAITLYAKIGGSSLEHFLNEADANSINYILGLNSGTGNIITSENFKLPENSFIDFNRILEYEYRDDTTEDNERKVRYEIEGGGGTSSIGHNITTALGEQKNHEKDLEKAKKLIVKYMDDGLLSKAIAVSVYYKAVQEGKLNEAVGDAGGSAPPTDGDKEDTFDQLEKGESLQAWMMTINNFFNSGKVQITGENSLGFTPDEANKFKYISLANYGHIYISSEFKDGDTDWEDRAAEVQGSWITGLPEGEKQNYELTPYEDYLLRVYFNVQAQYRVPQNPTTVEAIDEAYENNKLLEKFSLNNGWSKNEVDSDGGAVGDPAYLYKDMTVAKIDPEAGMNESSAQNNAGLAANSMKAITDNLDSPNVRVLAQNFSEAVKYLTYGVISNDAKLNYNDGNNTSAGSVPYNENITKIIPELDFGYTGENSLTDDTQIMKTSVDFSAFGLPELKNIGRVVNTDFARKKASQLYLSLMYIKKYASVDKELNADTKVVVKSTESVYSGLSVKENSEGYEYASITKDDLENKKLEELKAADSGKTEDDKKKSTIDKALGAQIRAYIQIYEGLEYIGVLEDKWLSPELLKICDYYKEILVYKDIVSSSTYDAGVLSETQPFSEFFSLEPVDGSSAGLIGDRIQKGIAASATYLPLVSNTFDYDAISIIEDDTFVEEFHYKFGFHRKALFIDTNSSAAMQAYVAGQKDTLKIATLADMLQSEKDIVLYVDPGMYNVRTIAEKQNLSYNKLQNTEEAGKEDNGFFGNIADSWSEWRNLDAAAICKTSGNNLYSSALTSVKAFGTDTGDASIIKGPSKDHYILSTDGIDEYYDQDEYTDIQGFAFVSGIYRCSRLLTICQQQSANPKPIFVSSPTLFNVTGISKKEFNSVYNYIMVKNLKANLGLDYKTELDLESPLFIDVYGNITTQSGLVVIPAASNASLYEPDKYSIITAGLISLANNPDAWHLPIGNENIDKFIDDGFEKNLDTGYWEMQNKTTENVMFSFSNLPLQSAGIRKSLYKEALSVCDEGINGVNTFKPRINMIMEVMRGAPIENINFDDEGLSGFRNIDKTGIYIAYRIEQLGDVLLSSSDGNSLLKMPNLAFMKGIEYVVVFVFKILLSAGVVILMIKLYVDGMSNSLGIKTGLEFMVAIISIIASIVLLPTLINFSYYQTNKQLLQKEAAYLMILNTEKEAEGKEVGIKEIREPTSTTRFYVKMEEIKVPWWNVISDVYSSEMFATMKDVYEESYSSSVYSTFPGAIMRGNGVYVPIEELFKSSEIRFKAYSETSGNKSENELPGVIYQAVKPNSKMSYVLPYYAIIDKLLTDATNYNDDYKTMAYRTKILQNGNVRTVGLLDAYFKSNRFLGSEERNLFGLFDIYGVPYSTDSRIPIWSEDELDTMSKSLWHNKDAFTEEEVEYKLNQLDQIGKEFIVNNRALLNKVTDETFIKVFAVYMSVKHNELFKVPAARGIELMDIDTKDIIRLSLASKADVMHSISMSFGRFTYTQAGTFGTILMAFLMLIYYLTSLIRPTVMLILVGCLIFSYVYKKVMRYEQNHSFEGYIVSCALICMVNIVYALVIKLSVLLPELGADPVFSILGQIFLQVVYTGVLAAIGLIVMKNSKDLGFFTYKTFYDAHMSNKMSTVKLTVNKLMANSVLAPFSHTANNMRNEYLGNRRTNGLTGDDIYNNMLSYDEQREEDVLNNNHIGR